MDFNKIVEFYERIRSTRARLEIIDIRENTSDYGIGEKLLVNSIIIVFNYWDPCVVSINFFVKNMSQGFSQIGSRIEMRQE